MNTKDMKQILSLAGMLWLATTAWAQTSTSDRMERDIEVAENVLSTLIKQQVDGNMFFPVEVEGSYRSGFGVTFTVPNFSNFPGNYMVIPRAPRAPRVQVYRGQANGYSYRIETDEDGEVVTEEFEGDEPDEQEAKDEKIMLEQEKEALEAEEDAKEAERRALSAERDARQGGKRLNGLAKLNSSSSDDLKVSNKYIIEAAKTFLADYSTVLSQLKPEERITITNRSGEGINRYWRFMGDEKRFYLSIEASGTDVKQYQSGKLTRDQFVGKIKVVESEVAAERSQDLELMVTIFDRLYQPDLSSTYFTEEDTYYERLKDYGAIFYMNVYSSNQQDRGYFSMPTLHLERVSQEERDKKVKELYPIFEKELKENILEYGRTLRSLKPEEILAFNVRLTKCKACGIPSTLEITVKASVLTEYMSGKLDKNTALAKLEVKKGADQ
jgi:hypothetical protein